MPFYWKIIKKSMILYSYGHWFARQTNIGLDKENFTGAFTYNWTPKKTTPLALTFQFVQNLNPQNYFNVYGSSYRALNEIGKSIIQNRAILMTIPI
jgi:hypothetical protein